MEAEAAPTLAFLTFALAFALGSWLIRDQWREVLHSRRRVSVPVVQDYREGLRRQFEDLARERERFLAQHDRPGEEAGAWRAGIRRP